MGKIKVKLVEFADRLDVGCEKKKVSLRIFSLNNSKDKIGIY